jgi:preprotein translocase subunit SecD
VSANDHDPTRVECVHVEATCGTQAFWAGVIAGVIAGLCLAAIAKWWLT